MNSKQMLCQVLGFKEEAVIMFTDNDWILAIQPGNMDKEILGAGKIPATCWELGFSNKLKLKDFLDNNTTAELVIGEGRMGFEYDDKGNMQIDYARMVGGDRQIMDTKEMPKAKVEAFKEVLRNLVF